MGDVRSYDRTQGLIERGQRKKADKKLLINTTKGKPN